MAYGIMPELKEPYVCETECSHVDCKANREMVGTPCAVCHEPIVSGQKFQESGSELAHALCDWELIEAR